MLCNYSCVAILLVPMFKECSACRYGGSRLGTCGLWTCTHGRV